MAKTEALTPAQVVAALDETKGLVYLAADKLGCAASTVYRYADRHPTVKQAIRRHKGKRLDICEAKLWQAIDRGEAYAICFYLKTQGQRRGYSERPRDLPPLEALLAALPAKVAAVVRKALAAAVHAGGTPGGAARAQRRK